MQWLFWVIQVLLRRGQSVGCPPLTTMMSGFWIQRVVYHGPWATVPVQKSEPKLARWCQFCGHKYNKRKLPMMMMIMIWCKFRHHFQCTRPRHSRTRAPNACGTQPFASSRERSGTEYVVVHANNTCAHPLKDDATRTWSVANDAPSFSGGNFPAAVERNWRRFFGSTGKQFKRAGNIVARTWAESAKPSRRIRQ